MELTVLIGTYGGREWADLARDRALPSAAAQGLDVIHVHGETLHDARNAALDLASSEWVVHLDADDELEPGFAAAIAAGTADLRAPAVRYIRKPRDAHRPPIMPRVSGHVHACTADCLPAGNWLVVGTAVRAELVRKVGGWRDFPWSEDWDLWLRCWRDGATIEPRPEAVYRAHVRPDSRNRAPDRRFKLAAHDAIHRANFPEQYAA